MSIAQSPRLTYKKRVRRNWLNAIILLLLLFLGGVGLWMWRVHQLDHSQDIPILRAARHYGVNPALVKAVVWRESRFNPVARGGRGEIGLMQVIPSAAAADWAAAEHITNLAPLQLENPLTNTLAGAWYLQKLLHRYSQTDNPLPYALADYNAGRGNVLKWMQGSASTNSTIFANQISFPSTRHYVKSVTIRFEHYQTVFPQR